MQSPEVMVLEDGRELTNLLRNVCAEQQWLLREVRSVADCRTTIAAGWTGVAVIKLDDLPGAGWEVLTWLRRHRMSSAVIAVGAECDFENAHSAWNWGARHVVTLDRARTELALVVRTLGQQIWKPSHDTNAAQSR